MQPGHPDMTIEWISIFMKSDLHLHIVFYYYS